MFVDIEGPGCIGQLRGLIIAVIICQYLKKGLYGSLIKIDALIKRSNN